MRNSDQFSALHQEITSLIPKDDIRDTADFSSDLGLSKFDRLRIAFLVEEYSGGLLSHSEVEDLCDLSDVAHYFEVLKNRPPPHSHSSTEAATAPHSPDGRHSPRAHRGSR